MSVRVLGRLAVLAGVAALLALGVRVVAERRLPRSHPTPANTTLVPTPTASLAASVSSTSVRLSAASATAPIVSVAVAPAPFRRAKVTPAASASAKATNAGFTVTQEELDEALKTRLGGATTRPVRDEHGKVIALSVHGVGKLAKFGVLEGDRLVSANGHSLQTPDEALSALGALQHAKRVTFVLARGDARYAVTVVLDGPS